MKHSSIEYKNEFDEENIKKVAEEEPETEEQNNALKVHVKTTIFKKQVSRD